MKGIIRKTGTEKNMFLPIRDGIYEAKSVLFDLEHYTKMMSTYFDSLEIFQSKRIDDRATDEQRKAECRVVASKGLISIFKHCDLLGFLNSIGIDFCLKI